MTKLIKNNKKISKKIKEIIGLLIGINKVNKDKALIRLTNNKIHIPILDLNTFQTVQYQDRTL